MYRRAIVWICLVLNSCGTDSSELQRSQSPADAARLVVSSGLSFQFPTQFVGVTDTETFTVENQGLRDATSIAGDFGLSATFRFPGGFPGTGGDCGVTLSPGASCTVEVSFSPQYIADFQQALKITYYNGYSNISTDYPILRGRGQ